MRLNALILHSTLHHQQTAAQDRQIHKHMLRLPVRLIFAKPRKALFSFVKAGMSTDPTEVEVDQEFELAVGITEFANASKGVQGIVKQRYSDFIVREVAADGSISYLTDICGKALEERWFSAVAPSEAEDDRSVDAVVQFILSHVTERVEGDDLSRLTYFVGQCMEKSADCPESYVAFPDLDKAARTAVHGAFKAKLGEFIETESAQVDGKTYIKMLAKHKRPGNANKRKRNEWPQGLSDFLRFTLLKENIDTMSAATVLNNTLRCGSGANGITYSGTKDKRGVTVQKCTVYRRKPSDFTKINASTRVPTILCGDFEYVKEPAQLGDGGGNRFEIVLRALNTNDEAEILGACTAMQQSGFINYFGLQRFGKGGTRSHEFGKAILKSDWESCVRMLFTAREGDRQNIAAAKELFEQGDFSAAAKAMPEKMQSEKWVLQRLVNNPTDFMAAYSAVPKSARLMCAHAYQSYLWNKAVSRKLQLHGPRVVEGDLVLLAEPSRAEKQSSASAQGEASGEAAAAAAVHVVTAEDVAVQKYTIDDVVLPVPGYESVYPSNEIGAFYDELLAADGLSRRSHGECNPMYREKGAYRRILQRPGDFQWKAIPYNDRDADLAETELARFRTGNGTDKAASSADVSDSAGAAPPKFWALQLKFSLPPGTYATMLLREITKSSTESQFQAQLTKNAASSV